MPELSGTVRMKELITAHYFMSHSPCKALIVKLLRACQDMVSTDTDEPTLAAGAARGADTDERFFCLLLHRGDREASLSRGVNAVRLMHVLFAKKIKRRQPCEWIPMLRTVTSIFMVGKALLCKD